MANTQRSRTPQSRPAQSRPAQTKRRKKKSNGNNYLYLAVGLIFVAIILGAVIIVLTANNTPEVPDMSDTTSSDINSNGTSDTSDISQGEGSESQSKDEPLKGWKEENGNKYYYSDNGEKYTGVNQIDGAIYVFAADGAMQHSGWATQGNDKFYLNADGSAHLGWLELEGNSYYFKPDGKMAIGKTEIAGENHFFDTTGAEFAVANPWNSVCSSTQEFEVDLVTLPGGYGDANKGKVDRSCYDDLMAMMDECYHTTGRDVYVVSGHRTYNYQANNFKRQVNGFLNQGYSQSEAERLAAEWVAVPGTSEHHLGLAVDIIDTQIWDLVEEQEDLEGQQWLMENSWKFGFILRYPKDGKAATGINYEPWHYRYLGKELAKAVYDSGLTLEEYIDSISQ